MSNRPTTIVAIKVGYPANCDIEIKIIIMCRVDSLRSNRLGFSKIK